MCCHQLPQLLSHRQSDNVPISTRESEVNIICQSVRSNFVEQIFNKYSNNFIHFRSKQWVTNLRWADLGKYSTEQLYKNYTICAKHFEDSQFKNTEKKRLTAGAIPTLFDIAHPPPQITPKWSNPKQKYAQQIADTEILQYTTPEPEQLPPTPQKIEMEWKIQCLQVHLSQQRKKTKNALKKSSELKEALSCLKGYLPSDSFAFTESQVVKAQKKSKHRYWWNTKEKVLALSIYFHSKKAYCILSRLFVLPSMRTLQHDLQKMSIEPGFVENVFVALGQKVCIFADTI